MICILENLAKQRKVVLLNDGIRFTDQDIVQLALKGWLVLEYSEYEYVHAPEGKAKLIQSLE